MAPGIAAPRIAPIYYVCPRAPDHTLVFFKNNESATCGFNIVLFGMVQDMRPNVGDEPNSWRTVSRHPSSRQK